MQLMCLITISAHQGCLLLLYDVQNHHIEIKHTHIPNNITYPVSICLATINWYVEPTN